MIYICETRQKLYATYRVEAESPEQAKEILEAEPAPFVADVLEPGDLVVEEVRVAK